MDSTLPRYAATALRTALATLALAALPARALNHETVVSPLPAGPFAVACSNIAQDPNLIAPDASASDYWEGRPVNGIDHYVDQILANPSAVVRYDAPVPDLRSLYPGHAGDNVTFVAIVCYPTSQSNTDPDYVLPGTGDVIPHMQLPGQAPKLISLFEYESAFGTHLDPPPPLPARLPLVVYSHGLGGSPIGSGYVQSMVRFAAHGFMVAAPFHGDARFSRVRVEDLSDFAYLIRDFDRVVEMQLMRPVALKAMLDHLLADPGFAPGIDQQRIGGFGASMGGEAMAFLLGAKATTSIDKDCSDTVRDPRIRAAVGYVPYAGQPFLPAFCSGQEGAKGVNRPYLAMSGTADTTAPIVQAQQAVNNFASSHYLVQLVGGKHELRPEDADDLFTWSVTFLDAYLDVATDPGAMARFIRMDGVTGGRDDSLVVDVHVPFAPAQGDAGVVEFYNTILGHYFMAAGPGEVDGIDHGAAGPGWERTGESFKAVAHDARQRVHARRARLPLLRDARRRPELALLHRQRLRVRHGESRGGLVLRGRGLLHPSRRRRRPLPRRLPRGEPRLQPGFSPQRLQSPLQHQRFDHGGDGPQGLGRRGRRHVRPALTRIVSGRTRCHSIAFAGPVSLRRAYRPRYAGTIARLVDSQFLQPQASGDHIRRMEMRTQISATAQAVVAAAAISAMAAVPVPAQAAGDVIQLGSAISITGKYSQEGKNASDGYNFAVEGASTTQGRREGRRQVLQARGQVLRRRVDAGAHRAAARAHHQPGRHQVHARTLRLRPDQGRRAGDREIQDPDGRGRGRFALALHPGLQVHVRGAVDLGAVPVPGDRPRRRAGGEGRQEAGGPEDRDVVRERSVLARRARGRGRRGPRSTA